MPDADGRFDQLQSHSYWERLVVCGGDLQRKREAVNLEETPDFLLHHHQPTKRFPPPNVFCSNLQHGKVSFRVVVDSRFESTEAVVRSVGMFAHQWTVSFQLSRSEFEVELPVVFVLSIPGR